MKPWKSFIEKTFRKNILNNSNWPNAPNEGWVLPENWLSNINDIVRTTFVVKYLDGVEFLMNKLILNCESCGLACEKSWEARDEVYYALHMNIRQNYLVKEMDWNEEIIYFITPNFTIEVRMFSREMAIFLVKILDI